MACKHINLSFTHRWTPHHAHGERMYELAGHCADCGAPMVFVPVPTLTLDSKNFQIPFRMGAPEPVNLIPKPAGPMLIGGARKGMH